MSKLEEKLKKNMEARMAQHEAENAGNKVTFGKVRTMIGLNWYRLKMKAKIVGFRIKSIWSTDDVQAAGMMVGVNAQTGSISLKMVMLNGDECVCAMDVDGAEHIVSELNMAISSVSMG
jgi:hypothetical protein